MTHEFKVGDIVQLKPEYAAESEWVGATVCVVTKRERSILWITPTHGTFNCNHDIVWKPASKFEYVSQSPRDKISRILMGLVND